VPAVSSETSSAVSDRGEYANDQAGGHVTGYDTERPSWGQTAEVAWSAILQKDFMSGGFTWTGWDYKGEPTPYAWPDINSHFGIIDIAGFWKDRTCAKRYAVLCYAMLCYAMVCYGRTARAPSPLAHPPSACWPRAASS
jgi:hypothetical protein